MADAAPLRQGDPERVGGYRLTGRIGEGGQGVVYLGRAEGGDEPADGAPVAVKLLRTEFAGDTKARARFAAELATAKRVTPFCTPRVIAADVEGDTPYLVSEYIDGPSLRQLVDEGGPLSGVALDRLAVGSLTALAAIHQAGIVHRDFKPSNVLLAADGPRVIDFGIARALDATGTFTSTAVGTPAFMAPEQIAGHRVGPEADIFAWAGTMVYAATGRPPFGQDSIPAVMNRILHHEADLDRLAGLGRPGGPLRDIVAACLAKDPRRRPTAHQILLRFLGGSVSGQPAEPAGARAAGEDGRDDRSAAAGPAGPGTDALLTAGARAAAATPPKLAGTSPPGAYGPPAGPPPGPPGTQPPSTQPPGTQPQGVPPYGPGTHPAGYRPYPPVLGANAPGGPVSPRVGLLVSAGAAALVLIIVLGTFVLLRFTSGPAGPTPPPGGTSATFAMALGQVRAVEPANVDGLDDMFLVRQLFTGLTEVRPDGRVVNRVARAATPDGGCTTWTFQLNGGGTFSNGEAVTAESFVRGWSRTAASKNPFAGDYLDTVSGFTDVRTGQATTLSGVTATGPQTLTVKLTRPDCDFATRTAHPAFAPVPRDAGTPDNAAYNERPVGNGPFRLAAWTRGSSLTLVRNETYAFTKPKIRQVTVREGASGQVETAAFSAGELDWAALTPADLPGAASRYGSRLVKRDLNGMIYLLPVTDRAPLKSKKARQAVSYAIDRAAISRNVLGGFYRPAGGMVPAAVPGFGQRGRCDSCDYYDPQKAKQLAAESGLDGDTKVRLRFSTGNYEQAMRLVGEQLKQNLGWDVRIEPVSDFSAYIEDQQTGDGGGLFRFSWLGDYLSPDTFLYSLLHSKQLTEDSAGKLTGTNYSRYRSSTYDGLVDRALQTGDPAARTSAYREAEKVAIEDMPLIPLWEYTQVRAANTAKFGGLTMDVDGYPAVGVMTPR